LDSDAIPRERRFKIFGSRKAKVSKQKELVCREVVELVTIYLDESLGEPDRSELQTHLDGCPHCSTYLDQIKATITHVSDLKQYQIEQPVQFELVQVYLKWRKES